MWVFHFLIVAKGHVCMIIKTGFSQKQLGHFNQIVYVSFQVQENEFYLLFDC